ncbi:MAG: protein-L-isoaspartate(D-aspartate) O-methyltransferase [Anaerolineae bacterium]|nr:protein-L-isoaspartate(D-aspartate) O-methyltransferase [Anaerolineae bacterium]MDK1081757.1 protein-L-isoaspartate(D-aspartate) O-methyltransferase [Anaerolineae bacterium]MDK1118223.1 protein-L-isoaspartate(D-aspartate) O-methyltransferase [Anaerolineae bacterium]
MGKFKRARKRMIKNQIFKRGLTSPRLLQAFESIPRHKFVPEEHINSAYKDMPLPIGHSQTISQPYIVALMTNLLNLKGDERVLEIGTGSGYQAAILGLMASEVHTVELNPELASNAEKILKALNITGIHVHIGDGSLGWQEEAPYNGILVAAAAPTAPKALLDQLEEGGRLVLPIGARGHQQLQVWIRKSDAIEKKIISSVAFVPLRGKFGWDPNKW